MSLWLTSLGDHNYNAHPLRSPIAQLVEQMTVNHWVPGSSPGRGAKLRLARSGNAITPKRHPQATANLRKQNRDGPTHRCVKAVLNTKSTLVIRWRKAGTISSRSLSTLLRVAFVPSLFAWAE